MTRLIRLELFKLARRPMAAVLCLLVLFCFKTVALLAGGSAGARASGSAYAYIAESASLTMKLWWFLALCLAAASFSGDRSRGVLRMQLARPVRREGLLAARAIAFALAALLLLAADAGAGLLLAGLFRSFGDVADPALQGPQYAASAMALSAARCYLLTFLGFLGILSLGLLFSVVLANPTTAIGWAAGTGLVLEGVRLTLGEPIAGYVLTGYTTIHFDRLSDLARGIAVYTPPDYWWKAAGVPLTCALFCHAASLRLIRHADIRE